MFRGISFQSHAVSKQQARKYTKTCLKVILGDMYISYSAALEMCGLETLYDRRQKRCLEFALKNVKHNRNKKMFPTNMFDHGHKIREHERYKVNFARTEKYKRSAIPYCQRLLNEHLDEKQ